MNNNPKNILIYSPYDVDLDNPNFNWQRFCEQLRLVSPPIKELMFNLNTALFLRDNIVNKFSLTPEQGASLSRLLRDILTADIYLGDIIEQIKEKLDVTEEKAREITSIVLEQLLAPILEELRSMHRTKFKKDESLPNKSPVSANPVAPPPPINHHNVLDLSQKNNP